MSRAHGTAVLVDRFKLKYPRSSRKKKKNGPKRRKSPAQAKAHVPDTLAQVDAWKRELEDGSTTRAAIARRENLTRARITQLMYLTQLPIEMRAAIIAGQLQLSLKQLIAVAQNQTAQRGAACR